MIQQVPARLRISVKLAYGVGAASAGVMESAFNIFLLFFYQQVIGLDPALCGLALFISLCVDAVIDPAIGVWSDGLRTRLGRRHPLMYGAIVPLALTLYAVFAPPAALTDVWRFVWLLLFATAARIALSLFVIPYLALVPELSTSVAERTTLNSLTTIFSWVFGLLNTLLGYQVFMRGSAAYPQGLRDPAGYPRLALFGGCTVAIAMAICAFGTQRAALAAQPDDERIRAIGPRELPSAIAQVLKSASYRAALFAGLAGAIGFGMIENMNNYMNVFFWGFTSEEVGMFIVVIFFATLVVVPATRLLMIRFGNREVAIASAIFRALPLPTVVAMRFAGLMPQSHAPLFAVLSLAVFVSYGAIIAGAPALGTMMADLTDDHELHSGSRQEGLLFAANMFISKAMSGLGTLAAGMLLRMAHFPANAKPGEVAPEIVHDLGLYVALGVFFFGAAMLYFLTRYRLDLASHARAVHLVTIRRHAATLTKGLAKPVHDFTELVQWMHREPSDVGTREGSGPGSGVPKRPAVAAAELRRPMSADDDSLQVASAPATRVAVEALPDDSFEALLRRAARVSEPSAGSRSRIQPGTTLAGRLSVLSRIGEGGMGVVYEAFDTQRKTRVALKSLARADAGSVYRLKNEFRALADVRHENLVALHELFSVDETWFFTMDLVEGERFDAWVRPRNAANGGALDLARLRAALPQLVAAIRAVHAAGKLHRDLKPSNVLVARERVVVLDFGLSVESDLGGVGQTVADDSVSGTPGYMAPEQAQGLSATTASDFYALGVMLFEALTGRLPFEGRTGEMIAAKQTREAPRASSLADDVPADLDTLCAGLLARDPDARREAIAVCTWLAEGASAARASTRPHESDSQRQGALLLGREAELQALRDALEASIAGQPVVMFVAGESGIGKSALCAAFVEELRAGGRATVLAGRCLERENVPYKGFDALVDELSRYLRKLSGQDAAALLPREVYALARIFPVLDRIPVVSRAPKKNVSDPQDLKQRAVEAFGELIARIRDRGPLVLLIDDLQWIDRDSMRFMRALCLQRDPAPVLVVCAHRSEGSATHELLQAVIQGAQDNAALEVRTLALSPLPHGALVSLAQRLLPSSADPHAADTFATEAQGSPFFAAELARAASLARRPGKLSLTEALSLHVASLPVEAQTLLSLLALGGEPLSPQVASEAANLSDGHAALDRLRNEQLVRVSFDAEGERRLECYHDKIREHVGGALEPLRARELALGLSRALLAEPDAHPELLARVLELAGMIEQAAQHAARAAERAFAALAFERAAMLYEKALAHGVFEPARVQTLRVGKAEALGCAGMGVRAAEAFLTAAEGASGDGALVLRRKAGEHYLLCGEVELGHALFSQVLNKVGVGFPRSFAAALASVGWWRSRLRLRGLHYTPRTDQSPATMRKLELLRTVTHCLIRCDEVRAAAFSARWVLCALQSGHEVELARALAWELHIAARLGLPEPILDEIRSLCAQLCERTRDPNATGWFFYTSGTSLAMAGDISPGIALMDRTLEMGNRYSYAALSYDLRWITFFRTEFKSQDGQLKDALEISQAELERAITYGDDTLCIPLAMQVMLGCLAVDRPELATRVRESAAARASALSTVSETFWLVSEFRPQLYRGRAREAWYLEAARRTRFMRSFIGRFLIPGWVEGSACGVAAAAASQAASAVERRALARTAERLAMRAMRIARSPGASAVLACVRGDRADAITAIRALLCATTAPLQAQVLRRRLGELLGDDEGAALIVEADAFLRAGGVVDPARFTATMLPGIELPTSSALERSDPQPGEERLRAERELRAQP